MTEFELLVIYKLYCRLRLYQINYIPRYYILIYHRLYKRDVVNYDVYFCFLHVYNSVSFKILMQLL